MWVCQEQCHLVLASGCGSLVHNIYIYKYTHNTYIYNYIYIYIYLFKTYVMSLQDGRVWYRTLATLGRTLSPPDHCTWMPMIRGK